MTSYIHPPTARKGPTLPNHSAIKCIKDGTSLLGSIYPHYFWRNVIDVNTVIHEQLLSYFNVLLKIPPVPCFVGCFICFHVFSVICVAATTVILLFYTLGIKFPISVL